MARDGARAESTVRGSALAAELHSRAGAVVAVVRPQETQTITLGRDVAASTPIQIGSVTKVFTGLLLADAVLRCELTLDKTVDELLLDRPGTDRSIMVRNLATHTSGLPRLSLFARRLHPDPYKGYTRAQLLRYLRRKQPTLAATPTYSYSNLGFAVIGAMLEKACGETYASLLQRRVLTPLGLQHMRLALAGETMPVQHGYAQLGKTPIWLGPRPPVWHFDAYAPCGGLTATADELMLFVRQLLDPDGPMAEALRFSSLPQADIPGGAIGLAWHLPVSRRFVWHNGSTFGHSAYVAVAHESGVGVVAVANQAVAAKLTQLGHALMRYVLA